jgi:hypothetical protein
MIVIISFSRETRERRIEEFPVRLYDRATGRPIISFDLTEGVMTPVSSGGFVDGIRFLATIPAKRHTTNDK